MFSFANRQTAHLFIEGVSELIICYSLIKISIGIDSRNTSVAAAVLEGTDTVSESRFLQERQGRQGVQLVSVEHSIRRNSLEDSVAVVSIEPVALAVMATIVVDSIWHSSQRSSTVQKFIMLQALVGQQQLAELVSDSMQHRRIRLGSHHHNLEHYQRKFHWIKSLIITPQYTKIR